MIAGAVIEIGERTLAFRAPWREVRRRAQGLPRGAWGMSLAHLGLGVFVLGAAFETTWRMVEVAEVLRPGDQVSLGAYHLTLQRVETAPGPNYDAERAVVVVADRAGRNVCTAEPERRTFDTGGLTTSKVALCLRGLDDVYVVLGERRIAADGRSVWLVRAFWNRWVRLIFLGPLLMAMGGAISLSDRRLRMAAGRRLAALPVAAE